MTFGQTAWSRSRYGSRHSLADQGDFGAAGESGPLVVPAGAGLMLAAEH